MWFITLQWCRPIEITELDTSNGWWYFACQVCWRTTKLDGNVYRCVGAECTCIKEQQRYRINIDAKDINPVEGREEAIGRFTFFGDQARAITGYKEDILIKISEGKPEGYVPSAVSSVVGKKYSVLARVTQDIYKQDNVPFHVSSVELIDTPAQPSSEATRDDHHHVVEQNSNQAAVKDASPSSEGDTGSVTTPPRDVIEEFGSGPEEGAVA